MEIAERRAYSVASSTSTFCHTTYTTFDYCRVVADILLPLLSTVERDFFFAIIVRVSPTTERKVMACSRFDTPPSCTVDNASFLVAVNALTLFLFARIDSQLRNANPRDFSRLFIGRTAVVGWPLNKRFTKIGDNLDAVLALACAVVDSPDFLARDAVFCPGGRGKFCPLNGTYTARLTIDLGARYNIQMAMHMQSQPFTRFSFVRLRHVLSHCLGMSWMHGGAATLCWPLRMRLVCPLSVCCIFVKTLADGTPLFSVRFSVPLVGCMLHFYVLLAPLLVMLLSTFSCTKLLVMVSSSLVLVILSHFCVVLSLGLR